MARRIQVAVLLGVLAALTGVGAAQAAYTETTVVHGATHTETFDGDICTELGDPASRVNTVVFTLRTETTHVTARPDGSFSFTFIETGTYTVDFEDPALADQTSQFTGTQHFTLTPGGTEVTSVTWHDFPTGLRIWVRFHATVVNGEPVVERKIQKVTGCP